MKKDFGEEDFYTIADDNIYFESEADEFLEQKKVKVVYPNTRYLKFISATSKEFCIDTKSKSKPGWFTILFDPNRESPILVHPIDIVEDYERYFVEE